MAKPKTARDLAKQAELGHAPAKVPFNPVRIAEGIGFALLLALSMLFFYQGWLAQQRDSDEAALAEAAEAVTALTAREAASAVARVEKVAQDPATISAFEAGAAMDLAQVRNSLREKLGNPVDVEIVIGGDVMAAVGDDIAAFGYAKIDMLRQAETLRSIPPVQMLRETNESRSFAIAAPVLLQTQPIGYLLVRIEAAKVQQAIDAWRGEGRLELRQGTGDGVVLHGTSQAFYLDRNAATLPVSKTGMRVVRGLPPMFTLVPMGTWGGLALGLLCLAGAGALGWFRLRNRDEDDQGVVAAPAPAPLSALDAAKAKAEAQASAVAEAFGESAAPQTSGPPPAPRSGGGGRSPLGVTVDRSIFRAYDIRGVVDRTLTPDVANLIGRAVGSEVRARDMREVVVARDGRLSGPSLIAGLIEGLRATGCDVIDIGMVPTPVLYFATYELRAHNGVMVTGSHNPPDYNGFKIMVGGDTLSDQAIQNLYARIAENRYASGNGSVQVIDVLDAYVERISSDIQLESPLKIVADCGNGVPGVIAEKLLSSIGAEVMPLFAEVDGNFPNHHPDPSDPANLQDLLLAVKQTRSDLGVAFDGDGDRLGVVTPSGKIINPDRLLMLFSQDVLQRCPGASVIFDVKCTGHLATVIRGAGGIPIMWRTGHSLIKGKMKETEAELAGEMSGHFFFKERWFGFDDGLYAACRLLEIIAASGQDIDDLFAELPDSVSTPELKIQMQEGEHYRFIEKFKERARFDGARISNLDGVRADWDDGWGLVRCSNTTPVLVLRFDADNEDALLRIQDVFRKQLLAQDKHLPLPF